MKEIPLTQGKVALVDEEDYELLSQWKWTADKRGRRNFVWYAVRRDCSGNVPKKIYMHTLLMGVRGVDHVDNNGLNNQRKNLRAANQSQNGGNARMSANNTSGVKGVYWNKRNKKWNSRIQVHRKEIWLGGFDSLEDAAVAYKTAAKRYFGEFARTYSPV